MVGKGVLKIMCALLVGVWLAPVLASPGLPVTKGPVQPVPSWTGPPIDPNAIAGQWFEDVATHMQTVRPYEFYDNVYGHGGSAWKSSLAIEGYVNNLVFDGLGNIVSFKINTTIWNDMPGYGQWEEGMPGNSHGEWRDPTTQYQGMMWQTKLTTSFADDGILGNFPGPGGPYFGDELSQNIHALDYDQLAWYCWTPDNPELNKVPWGNYMVPTYDFGNISPGGFSTRNLPFGLYNPVAPGTPLFQFLMDAYGQQFDVMLNRTTSLKISEYFDSLSFDPGAPYPLPPNRSSDVSVFFVPEPMTMLLMALGGLALVRRRSR
jgi:hypothetical protein